MTQRDLAVDVVDSVLTSDLDESLMAERILDRLVTLGWRPPPEVSPRRSSPIQNGYDLALLGAGMAITAGAVAFVLAICGSFAVPVLGTSRLLRILDGVWALVALGLIPPGIAIGGRSLYRGRADR